MRLRGGCYGEIRRALLMSSEIRWRRDEAGLAQAVMLADWIDWIDGVMRSHTAREHRDKALIQDLIFLDLASQAVTMYARQRWDAKQGFVTLPDGKYRVRKRAEAI